MINKEIEKMKIISLGWGVQSFTLAAMVALGELEPIDYAVHVDTTYESILTYAFVKRWTPWLEEHGVRIITVKTPDKTIRLGQTLNKEGKGIVDIPAFTVGKGVKGHLRRQCTGDWKIVIMRRLISRELKQHELKKTPGVIEQWLGISLDESQRMKPANVKYIEHRWPLIEKEMSRHDCKLWLNEHDLPIPPRSACVFCPFHNKEEWHNIKQIPQDWAKAVQIDKQIRKARSPYDLFVCSQGKPLAECDFGDQ